MSRPLRLAVCCALALALLIPCGLNVCLAPPAIAAVRSNDRIDGQLWRKRKLPRDAMPDLSLKAGCLVTGDGRVLWSRAQDSERALASITKIMTAIVAIENSGPDARISIPAVASVAGESSAGLRTGEKMTRHELLEALLVKSGNDAALATAIIVAGSENAFVDMMNEKADELGLEHTHFKNPHGLDEKGHYSSAADIATMARYGMGLDEFRDIVGKKRVKFKSTLRTHKLENTNILLSSYTGATGVKTGWTDDAGYCVVESARRGDIELYAVILGTPQDLERFFEARDLLDFGFAHYRKQELTGAGTIVGRARVSNFIDRNVPVAYSTETSAALFDLSGAIERTLEIHETKAPVHAGDELGVARFVQDGKLVATVPLVATQEIKKPFFIVQAYYNVVKLWNRLF